MAVRPVPLGTALMSLCCLAVPLAAEAPGIPHPPRPGGLVPLWVDMGNDVLGFGPNNDDDYRTQQTVISGTWHGLIGTVDHSILTNRGPRRNEADPGEEARVDALTVSIGLLLTGYAHDDPIGGTEAVQPLFSDPSPAWFDWLGEGDSGARFDLHAVGLSIRDYGYHHGDELQNDWHEVVNSPRVELPYRDEDKDTAIGLWYSGSWTWTSVFGEADHVFSRWGVWVPGQLHVLSNQQAELSLGVLPFIDGKYWSFWAGGRYEGRTGYDGLILDRVEEKEEGPWAMAGLRLLRYFTFETGWQLDEQNQYGRVSFAAEKGSGKPTGEDLGVIGLNAGALAPAFSLVVQPHWFPKNWTSKDWRLGLLVDFRHGQAHGEEPGDSALIADQLTAGAIAEYSGDLFLGESIRPYAALSAGWRQEYYRESFDGDRLDDSSADRFVSVADLGLRVGSHVEDTALLTLGVSAWLPSSDAEFEIDGETVRYQRARLSPIFSIAASLGY